MANITGSWLGTYWQNGKPTRFEATFAQSNNVFSGRILDDGPQGEAQVSGDVIGRHIDFGKRYFSIPGTIHYTGTLSEDENFLSGQWNIGSQHSGPWEAHRSDNNLANELQKRLQQNIPVGGNR